MLHFDNARMLCARGGSVNRVCREEFLRKGAKSQRDAKTRHILLRVLFLRFYRRYPPLRLCDLCAFASKIHSDNHELPPAFDSCPPLPHTASQSILPPPDAFPKIAFIRSFHEIGLTA